MVCLHSSSAYGQCDLPAKVVRVAQLNPLPDHAELRRNFWIGTLLAVVAALGYSAANICLRAVSHCDATWVACVKALPTALLMGPWLLLQSRQQQTQWPTARVLGLLVIGALVGQAGNVLYQVALERAGLALSTPLMMGSLILAGALLGVLVLRERITLASISAMVMLVAAISILSLAANQATATMTAASYASVASGVGAACLCGVCFGVLGVFIRYGVSGRATVVMTTFTIATVGIVVLAAMSALRLGMNGLLATDPSDFMMMLQAGIWNAIAFLAVSKALQLTSVVYVNTVNGTQSAICAVAGILLFREPFSLAVVIGIVLTIGALLVMQLDRRHVTSH